MPMATETQLLYLEPDDEITSVVRRLRETDAPRVVLIASGRTKATTSAVALRLLAQVAAEEGREVALVADPFARSLAGEAGIPAFASVADANADGAVPLEPAAPRRAAIHVVRGEPAPAAPPPALVPPPASAPAAQRQVHTRSGDETQAVPLPAPPQQPTTARPRLRLLGHMPRAAVAVVLVATLLLTAGGVAAVLPSATVTITPTVEPLDPVTYELRFGSPQAAAGIVDGTVTHPVMGTYHDVAPAAGGVVLFNWNTSSAVEVPAGTQVAAQDVVFGTAGTIVVPRARVISFFPVTVQAGEASVGIQAITAGPVGNVAAEAIDTVLDEETAARLRDTPDNPERLVTNPEATAGGLDVSGPLVEQADVDTAVAALRTLLAEEVAMALAASSGAVIAEASPPSEPMIAVPDGLVGTRDAPELELAGSLAYDRAWVSTEQVEAAARERLASDAEIVPAARNLVEGSERITIVNSRRDGPDLVATVSVTAATAASIDEAALKDALAGMSFADASAALGDLGFVEITGWPEWVDALPRLAWRIDIDISTPRLSPSPQAS
jgi:hypothetical protein